MITKLSNYVQENERDGEETRNLVSGHNTKHPPFGDHAEMSSPIHHRTNITD